MERSPDLSELWQRNEAEIERLRAARGNGPPTDRELELQAHQEQIEGAEAIAAHVAAKRAPVDIGFVDEAEVDGAAWSRLDEQHALVERMAEVLSAEVGRTVSGDELLQAFEACAERFGEDYELADPGVREFLMGQLQRP